MHELVDEAVIGLARQPPLAQAEIIGIAQQLFVVGADVEHDRQALLRMHAGAGRIERELADRNTHAVGAEIAETEDALAVGDDDELCGIWPVLQQVGDLAAVARGDEHAARTLEDQAVFLAGEPDRRRVDQRLDLVDVVADDAEEQRLVAVMQRIQRDIFFEIVRQIAQIHQHALDLILHRQHAGRQQAAQAEGSALGFGEGGAFVEQGIAQQGHAVRRWRRRRLGIDPVRPIHEFPQEFLIRPNIVGPRSMEIKALGSQASIVISHCSETRDTAARGNG